VDDAVLALLYLTMHDDGTGTRAWKGHDWAAMDHLQEKGYIGNPRGKAKSVVITDRGKVKAAHLFCQLFHKAPVTCVRHQRTNSGGRACSSIPEGGIGLEFRHHDAVDRCALSPKAQIS